MSPSHPSPEGVMEALRSVLDPEVGVDIVTLGLVYGVDVEESRVTVTFTLTTPGCPLRNVMTQNVVAVVYALPGVEHVEPNLVWEPRWHPGMMESNTWSKS